MREEVKLMFKQYSSFRRNAQQSRCENEQNCYGTFMVLQKFSMPKNTTVACYNSLGQFYVDVKCSLDTNKQTYLAVC